VRNNGAVTGARLWRSLGLLLWTIPYVDGALNQLRKPTPRAARGQAIGLPATDQHVQLSGAIMLAATAALLIPRLRQPAAAWLALQTAGLTFIGHRFWEQTEEGPRDQQWLQFTKNLALIGTALYLAAGERPRGISLAAPRARRSGSKTR